MADPSTPAMLTLAGLAYRGFQDVLPGDPHEAVVRRALTDGLETLPSVKGDWGLVWGPVTSRLPLGVFDSSAMYVVRNRPDPRRYVVAIRGTNPISSSDWLFGDLWVGTTVRWPWPPDGAAAISTSTALGLVALLGMRWRPSSTLTRFAGLATASAQVRDALDTALRAGRAALSGAPAPELAHPSALETRVARIIDHWLTSGADLADLRSQFQRAASTVRVESSDLRRRWLAPELREAGIDLLTFLKTQADQSNDGVEVTVTGHSKGGALAPALALWLKETLDSTNAGECWDQRRQSQVRCHAFAGPTPGNRAFAGRIDARLGDGHHHLRNLNDLVTHAWQADELLQIPALYGGRSAPFQPLLPRIVASVQGLDYDHAANGVTTFAGPLDTSRPFAAEVVHQHMNAYLAHLGLLGPMLSAATFFI